MRGGFGSLWNDGDGNSLWENLRQRVTEKISATCRLWIPLESCPLCGPQRRQGNALPSAAKAGKSSEVRPNRQKGASVVVTNPAHIAITLLYKPEGQPPRPYFSPRPSLHSSRSGVGEEYFAKGFARISFFSGCGVMKGMADRTAELTFLWLGFAFCRGGRSYRIGVFWEKRGISAGLLAVKRADDPSIGQATGYSAAHPEPITGPGKKLSC
jgi:hypothetical protein